MKHSGTSAVSQLNPHHAEDENDDDDVDDELGDLFDDGAAPLKLGDYFKLGDYLEVQRSFNLSPVSALSTGSYLKDQALAAQAENEIQPRKSLQNALFAKKLPLEDDFDSDEEESKAPAPKPVRSVLESRDTKLEPIAYTSNSTDAALSQAKGLSEQDLAGTRTTLEKSPAAVQRKASKKEKSSPVKRKGSKKVKEVPDPSTAFEVVFKNSKQKLQKQKKDPQESVEETQPRRRHSKKSSKAVRHVDGEIISDKYGDEGLYSGSVTVDTELPHGYGEMKYDNERQYAGDWKSGRWHGTGRWSNPNGDGEYDCQFCILVTVLGGD